MVEKICRMCGDSFLPKSSRQLDCKKQIYKECSVCGKMFLAECSQNNSTSTCSTTCKNKYAASQRQKAYSASHTINCKLCGMPFNPTSNTNTVCTRTHTRICEVCGNSFELARNSNSLNVADLPRTCSKECATALRFKNGNPFSDPASRKKAIQTMQTKYGSDFYKKIFDKANATYAANTGYASWRDNPEVRSRQARSRMFSKLEKKVVELLDNYNIKYVHQYYIANEHGSHTFDFYLPDYKILIDADGVYFHSYISDPDGRQVLDSYDDIRLDLVPEDHIFHIIVETNIDRDFKRLTETIHKIDNQVFNSDSELFKWCRSIEFPYPQYSESRISADYAALCRYQNSVYTPSAKLGYSIISSYHRWLYHCHVSDALSPVEGWNDDATLKKAIKNRLIYVNEVDPSKVLRGLYISKLAPRVSIFNPILAKYLTVKYLAKFDQVFDPFSGFSGRMLGVCAAGKSYLGQDLNPIVVSESTQIKNKLELSAEITCKDVLTSSGQHECLLTCPPYGRKEIYNDEEMFQSCDDWISEIISRFTCKRYVFVVDTTDKYKDHVVETISTKSHFCKVSEYVVVIDNLEA